MKMTKTVLSLVAALAVTLGLAFDVEAKRLGGGGSMGKQNSNVTQRQAPDRDAAPSGSQAAPAAAPKPAQSPAPAAQGNRWLGPIAGLAAGLGLAALASALGFGEGLATIMMIALMAIAAVVVVRLIMARRAGGARPEPAYAGVSQRTSTTGLGSEAMVPTREGSLIGSNLERSPVEVIKPAQPLGQRDARWHVPADFDEAGFVRQAKVQFIRLQASFDAGNLDDLREFTSPQMYAELKMQIDERGEQVNRTEVEAVEASLLGIESTANSHTASVRFSGQLREEGELVTIDEVWNLSKPIDGSRGWVLAGIQQLN